MAAFEKRAWLKLFSMGPAYAVYFAIQRLHPEWLATMLDRISVLAAVACVHAAIYVIGLLAIKAGERGEPLVADERDHAIDGRSSRAAYYLMIFGVILVGMVLPFDKSGWEIVNSALAVIVAAETLRSLLTIAGYRRRRRLAR
ncbi:MAG: DUF2178 domain-containing protein [Parvularculaceae bacterium]|nr:DUF2178 domain-containing protein [Parvularculaceae bacterium]